MTAQLAETEIPARDRLREAQAALASALTTAETAADALARGKEHLSVLERLRDEAKAEVANEARDLAETFAETGVCAMIGGAAQRTREIKDELGAFEIAFGILVQKNSDAQAAISECDAAVASAVKGVIAQEVSPLLCRLWDNEASAAMLRLELQALQYCGKFGLAPASLSNALRAKPVNVFDPSQPLTWDRQKSFDKRKCAWCDLADALRVDADATLGD